MHVHVLPAYDISFIVAPMVITNCAPNPVIVDLYTTFEGMVSITH